MSNYVILTDSSCDLPASVAAEYGLKVIELAVNVDGTEYFNDLEGKNLDPKVFYDSLRNGAMAKTSAPSVEAFIDAMEPALREGLDVLYIGFSSGLSNTYNTGCIAAGMMKEKYPDRKILTVDSLAASLGQGLLVVLAAKEKAAGKTIEEVAEFAENTKLNIAHWFTVSDLMFLKRGGRISGVTAVVGTVLNIKPIMHVDNEGHLIPVHKVRGNKAFLKKLCGIMNETGTDIAKQTVFISHGDCLEQVNEVIEHIKAETGVTDFLINNVGPVIGAHSGPGTIAIFFAATER